ncbi:MAG: glycosyltransferase family 4 protein [Labilithrix sp.]|nr:glycosyltransferase family 4 protein [Labilithrix sp.]MCW5835808.1 glycosyltransferase family 4 protein [Labilithrix sp.]
MDRATALHDGAKAPGPARGVARPGRLIVFTVKPPGVSPGQRFRLEQWAPYVRERDGIEMDFVPFESPELTSVLYETGRTAEKALWVLRDFLRRAAHVVRARRYDAAVIYREASLIGPAIWERVLARAGIPFILDFDDAIWMPTQVSKANGLFAKLHFVGKTSTLCRLASAVTVGNEFLARYARERNPSTFVLPTSIDLKAYPVRQEASPAEPFVVSWSGSMHTLYNFEEARPALERLAQRRRLVVKVICNNPPSRPIAGAENVFVPWREQGEADAIGDTHVGIMPLQDEPYMRGKCGLKALQFMATGRPVVVSPVGMNSDLIQSGRNGFLARTPDEWVDALEMLAASPELRRRLGRAARSTIEEGYAGSVVAARFADVVERVRAARRR